MTSDVIVIDILEEVLKSIKQRGYDKTMHALRKETAELVFDDAYTTRVINTVLEVFSLEQETILYGKYIRGENKFAIGFIVYYLYMQFSLGDIKRNVFKYKDVGLLSKYRCMIDDLNPKYKNDLKYLRIKDQLDSILINKQDQ